jgi:8-oxo-dGTP pyrophosphatase MutT (NUDIX family)
MSDYIRQMRRVIGSGPLLQCGSAVILIDRDGRVLLHHRTDDGTWGLPGGALEPGERLEDAAVREVQEEVGLKCGSLRLFGIYAGPEMYYRYPNGHEVHNVSVIYLCREFSGAIRVDPAEGKDARFFAIEDLPAAISPPIRVVIRDLRARYNEIVKGQQWVALP